MDENFWIKKLDPLLYKLDEVPLIRGEKFSFADLCRKLEEKFSLNVTITPLTKSWQKTTTITSSLGSNPRQLCFTFAPLIGNVYFLLSSEDVQKITALCLIKKDGVKLGSSAFEEGFYRYLTLIVLEILQNNPTFKGLSLKLVENVEIKSPDALCLDLKITLNGHNFVGKIAMTEDFKRSWNEHFFLKSSISIEEMKKNLEVPLQVILGHCHLKKSELLSLSPGDFLVLDKAFFDPKSDESHALLSCGSSPIFQLKIKKNKMQILDRANYYEEHMIEDKEYEKAKNVEKNETTPAENVDQEMVPQIEEASSILNDVPMELTVELAKISMTLEKLMQLQSGNVLHLPVSIDDPVNITVNGKKIGRAELTSLGETLGIRILEI